MLSGLQRDLHGEGLGQGSRRTTCVQVAHVEGRQETTPGGPKPPRLHQPIPGLHLCTQHPCPRTGLWLSDLSPRSLCTKRTRVTIQPAEAVEAGGAGRLWKCSVSIGKSSF